MLAMWHTWGDSGPFPDEFHRRNLSALKSKREFHDPSTWDGKKPTLLWCSDSSPHLNPMQNSGISFRNSESIGLTISTHIWATLVVGQTRNQGIINRLYFFTKTAFECRWIFDDDSSVTGLPSDVVVMDMFIVIIAIHNKHGYQEVELMERRRKKIIWWLEAGHELANWMHERNLLLCLSLFRRSNTLPLRGEALCTALTSGLKTKWVNG